MLGSLKFSKKKEKTSSSKSEEKRPKSLTDVVGYKNVSKVIAEGGNVVKDKVSGTSKMGSYTSKATSQEPAVNPAVGACAPADNDSDSDDANDLLITKFLTTSLASEIKRIKASQEYKLGIKRSIGYYHLKDKGHAVLDDKINSYKGKHWDVKIASKLMRATRRLTNHAIDGEVAKEQLRRTKTESVERMRAMKLLRELHNEFRACLKTSKEEEEEARLEERYGFQVKKDNTLIELMHKLNKRKVDDAVEVERERQSAFLDGIMIEAKEDGFMDRSPLDGFSGGSSLNKIVCGSSIDKIVRGSSIAKTVCGSSIDKIVRGSSLDKSACGPSIAKIACGLLLDKQSIDKATACGPSIAKIACGLLLDKTACGKSIDKATACGPSLDTIVFGPSTAGGSNSSLDKGASGSSSSLEGSCVSSVCQMVDIDHMKKIVQRDLLEVFARYEDDKADTDMEYRDAMMDVMQQSLIHIQHMFHKKETRQMEDEEQKRRKEEHDTMKKDTGYIKAKMNMDTVLTDLHTAFVDVRTQLKTENRECTQNSSDAKEAMLQELRKNYAGCKTSKLFAFEKKRRIKEEQVQEEDPDRDNMKQFLAKVQRQMAQHAFAGHDCVLNLKSTKGVVEDRKMEGVLPPGPHILKKAEKQNSEKNKDVKTK